MNILSAPMTPSKLASVVRTHVATLPSFTIADLLVLKPPVDREHVVAVAWDLVEDEVFAYRADGTFVRPMTVTEQQARAAALAERPTDGAGT